MENVNPFLQYYYNFEIKGLSGKDMGIRNNSSLLGKLKQKYSTTKKQTPNPDKVRVQPDLVGNVGFFPQAGATPNGMQ